jgi:hypothetical protein
MRAISVKGPRLPDGERRHSFCIGADRACYQRAIDVQLQVSDVSHTRCHGLQDDLVPGYNLGVGAWCLDDDIRLTATQKWWKEDKGENQTCQQGAGHQQGNNDGQHARLLVLLRP